VTPPARRRLVITVCPRERGVVVLPLRRGGRRRRLDAPAVARHLAALAAERGLSDVVEIHQACAGGCWLPGPNVTVAIHPVPRPGERPDHVAIAWKTYVASLADLDALSTILEENLAARPERPQPEGPRRRA
jgi:hypothetical protein